MPLVSRPIILASGSPYRRKLLEDAGISFTVDVSNIDEDLHPLTDPEKYVKELATRKALAVAGRAPKDALVIGADTTCALGNEIIGKPTDAADAQRMIERACGTGLQRVITGVCVVDCRDMAQVTFSETSLVEMRPATREQIAAYVASGEPMGKCGALCIESGQSFVKAWRGSYTNIMGLPMERLLALLLKMASA
ncbi:MAG: septum formation protein Maf [Planctomycetes bacterium]|nr:septum formation protein Maf [Planctomycetota bacterium]